MRSIPYTGRLYVGIANVWHATLHLFQWRTQTGEGTAGLPNLWIDFFYQGWDMSTGLQYELLR